MPRSEGHPPFQSVDFEDCHETEFRALNLDWIREAGFPVEQEDQRQLADPRGSILDPGGEILVALAGEQVIGTCALLPHGPQELELAKLTVTPPHRGQGTGSELLQAAIERARRRSVNRIVLLSNSRLSAALRLFRRSGFVPVPLRKNPYDHADMAMALDLTQGDTPQPPARPMSPKSSPSDRP